MAAMPPQRPPVPCTVLSGFLGTGKTSLLSHILTNKKGLRVAVVVNDLGSINVDSELATVTTGPDGVVSLQNGCVCCVLKANLMEELTKLAAESELDAIVVECSGIAEPRRIAASFGPGGVPAAAITATAPAAAAGPTGTTGGTTGGDLDRSKSYLDANANARGADTTIDMSGAGGNDTDSAPPVVLDTLVTMVDCESFLHHFTEGSEARVNESAAFRKGEGASKKDSRNILDLLVDQIEVADVIVLNKTDLVSTAELVSLYAIVGSLNPHAVVKNAVFGQIELDQVLQTGLYGLNRNKMVLPASDAYNSTVSGQLGIASFTFQTRRPFHPVRLHNLVASWIPKGVLRSKGFICVAEAQDIGSIGGHSQLYWGHAGKHIRIHEGRPCEIHAVDNWPDGVVDGKACNFHDHCGAKYTPCTQIVFIGTALDRAEIEDKCSQALLTPDELSGKRPILKDGERTPIKFLIAEGWKSAEAAGVAHKARWTRIAVMLAAFTIIWNMAEGGVSIHFGLEAESISVISFGADAIIEVISASFVLWRLWSDPGTGPAVTRNPQGLRRERVATFCIGAVLVALAVVTITGSAITLARRDSPDSGVAGIIISSVSLSFMFFLWYAKMHAAIILDSRALEADASCSFGCITLSFVLLLGSGLYEISDALWWVDSVAAIVIALFIGWDGVDQIRAASSKDFDGCGCAHKPSRAAKFLRARLLTNGGELKAVVGKAAMPTLDMDYTQTGAIPYCTEHQQKESMPVDWSCNAPTEVAKPADMGTFDCTDECCVPETAGTAAAATTAEATPGTAAAAATTTTDPDEVQVQVHIPFPVCTPAAKSTPIAARADAESEAADTAEPEPDTPLLTGATVSQGDAAGTAAPAPVPATDAGPPAVLLESPAESMHDSSSADPAGPGDAASDEDDGG